MNPGSETKVLFTATTLASMLVFSCADSSPTPRGNMKVPVAPAHTAGCIQKRNSEAGEPESLTWIEHKCTVSYLSMPSVTLPCIPNKNTISIFQGHLLYKHLWKDCTEKRQWVPLLIRHADRHVRDPWRIVSPAVFYRRIQAKRPWRKTTSTYWHQIIVIQF